MNYSIIFTKLSNRNPKSFNFYHVTRPNVKVLNNLSITINQGQQIALGKKKVAKITMANL